MHFLTINKLNRHFKETHDVHDFKCKDAKCVESFETERLRNDHFAKRHKRKKCPHCKKMIVAYGLAKHIEANHIQKKSDVICELCGKVSRDANGHSAHLKQEHDPRGSLQCDICKQW